MTGTNKQLSVGFVGAGKVARALGRELSARSYTIGAVSSRSYENALSLANQIPGCKAFRNPNEVVQNVDVVFITTPDDAIASVCNSINWQAGKMVVHTSGADSRSVLNTASIKGALTGVFHPLATIISYNDATNPFNDITVTIEADSPLLEILEELARSLGADPLRLREKDRALYHASAVFMSNYVVTLTDIALSLWQEMGFDKKQAEKALLPLLKGTIRNIETAGLPACLTGPVSRGDYGTVLKHLDALGGLGKDLSTIYIVLAARTIIIAGEKGSLSNEQTLEMLSAINKWTCK
jgi:predicted short-subunit dehydrogenase-like oxidoreductase (DUF2520 family)